MLHWELFRYTCIAFVRSVFSSEIIRMLCLAVLVGSIITLLVVGGYHHYFYGENIVDVILIYCDCIPRYRY